MRWVGLAGVVAVVATVVSLWGLYFWFSLRRWSHGEWRSGRDEQRVRRRLIAVVIAVVSVGSLALLTSDHLVAGFAGLGALAIAAIAFLAWQAIWGR